MGHNRAGERRRARLKRRKRHDLRLTEKLNLKMRQVIDIATVMLNLHPYKPLTFDWAERLREPAMPWPVKVEC